MRKKKKLLCLFIISIMVVIYMDSIPTFISRSKATQMGYDQVCFPYDYDGCSIFRKSNQFGLVSISGEMITQPEYESINEYSYDSGVFTARKNNQTGYLSIAGQFYTDSKWTDVHDFHDGYGIAETADGFLVINSQYITVTEVKGYTVANGVVDNSFIAVFDQTGKEGVMDLNGNLVMDCIWDENDVIIREGCIAFCKNELWGLMDSYGTVLVSPQYEYAEFPSNGCVSFDAGNGIWKIYSTKGEFIFETPEHCSYVFYTGDYAVVMHNDDNGHWIDSYIIDKQGNMISSKPDYSIMSDFYCGRAQVMFTSGDFGYIDPNGEIICRGYKKTTDYYRDIAIVTDSNDQNLYIDIYGKAIGTVTNQ